MRANSAAGSKACSAAAAKWAFCKEDVWSGFGYSHAYLEAMQSQSWEAAI
jgi:hypothetical protein